MSSNVRSGVVRGNTVPFTHDSVVVAAGSARLTGVIRRDTSIADPTDGIRTMDDAMRRGLLIVVATFAVFAIVGCASNGPGATPVIAATPAGPTAGPTAAPSPTVPPPPGGPVPSQLLGSWIGRSDTVPPGKETLTLEPTTYRLVSADGASSGRVVVNGDEIDFFGADVCGLRLPKGVGPYRWTLVGEILHFEALALDPCGRAAVLADADYHR
jgi:hypothetical protein